MTEFEYNHPYVLRDGRRFKSLYCAAQTVFMSERNDTPNLIPVTCDGIEYGMSDLRSARNPHPEPDLA